MSAQPNDEPRELPQYAPLSVELAMQVPVEIAGVKGPLTITAHSVNEIKRYIALLKQNGLLVEQPQTSSTSADTPPQCPIHHKPMKPSKKPGAWFCSAKVGEGYCTEKVG